MTPREDTMKDGKPSIWIFIGAAILVLAIMGIVMIVDGGMGAGSGTITRDY